MATTVTRKGQVTIPKPVRDYLGIQPGSRVDFRRSEDGDVVIEKADGPRPPSRFAKARGSAGPGMTTDELMALLRGESNPSHDRRLWHDAPRRERRGASHYNCSRGCECGMLAYRPRNEGEHEQCACR